MLGFKKKKKEEKKTAGKDLPKPEKKDKGGDEPDTSDATENKAVPEKKKKRFSKKTIFTILLFFIIAGGASYAAYTFYFSPKNTGGQKTSYIKLELKHIHLPGEMLKFSFEYFPDLYAAMVTFNSQMNLLETEIMRIDGIGQKYPDQKKISDKEKKVWVKAENALQKTFLKIEKPVKEIYVLFQVNREMGLAQIEIKKKELTDLALAALTPVQEMTLKLKSGETAPRGFIKSNIYKLKKKFL